MREWIDLLEAQEEGEIRLLDRNQLYAALHNDPTAQKEIKYLNASLREDDQFHIGYWRGLQLLGDAAVQTNPYQKSECWLMHVSVRSTARNTGIAKLLVRALFEYCSSRYASISISSYTELGETYLKKVIEQVGRFYPHIKLVQPKSFS